MSDEDWAMELRRCAVVIADRQQRPKIQQEATVEEVKAASFAGYIDSPGDIGSEGFISESAPAARSGTNSDMRSSPWLPPSCMSPEIGESDSYL
jgi:hypothetical protein